MSEPGDDDLDYAREVYSPHGLGPDHGQVLVRWVPDEPAKGSWHWPDDLCRVECGGAGTASGG
ncbi:hypothetical protein [Pseudonocardia sp. HH130630-07]|uniref:hypothetical protein n=1 Tax=Pseudonocardia sp. HH130630-07 TaxID=1690815 RepID=UPI000814ECC7|nr:hypothetical protein [Pseudonocardia sp. HH130630-07]ANY08019.1 hypothetical protein AFB00_18890 [Pseudonocardia sp. HH130630-07]